MDDVTHISVRSGSDPEAPPAVVYVDAPADALDREPFASGRHRLERMPGSDERRPKATLWSWLRRRR